ncbi:MAG: hypothetical protein Q8L16_07855, partial [Hydrogenophaga sp.]|nr:hypothetical protein [Hydrogenophaga sp.]
PTGWWWSIWIITRDSTCLHWKGRVWLALDGGQATERPVGTGRALGRSMAGWNQMITIISKVVNFFLFCRSGPSCRMRSEFPELLKAVF